MSPRWLGCVVAALAMAAFACALGGQLVFDDIHSIAANRVLHDPGSWWRWLSDPSAFSESGRMFRPVVLLSLGGTLALSDAPVWLKLGNLVLHALCAWLAFGWLRRVGGGTRLAFVLAALFAVHPLLGEDVNLVSARSELLFFVGAMVALRAHLARWRGRGGVWTVAGIAVGTAIACGSKETGVVVPGLLLAQSAALHRGAWDRAFVWRALREAAPALLIACGYLALRKALLGQATVALTGRAGGDPLSGHGRALGTQLATMGALLPQAMLQMVVPIGLSLDPHVTFRSTFTDPVVVCGWLGVMAFVAAGLVPGPCASVRRLGTALMVASALPWVLIPLNVPLAEHRLYAPLLGFLCIVSPWLRGMAGARRVAFTGLCLLGIVVGNARSLDYRDEVALWRGEVAQNPLSFRAQWGLGAAFVRAARIEEAIAPLSRAVDLAPNEAVPLRHYAEVLVSLPDTKAQPWRALAVTGRYLAARPKDPWARSLAAQADLAAGRATGDARWFVAAEQQALACLEVGEPKGLVFRLAAAACRGRGDLLAALAHLDRSEALGLTPIGVRLDRVAVLRELGRATEAHDELRRAQREAPFDPAVLDALRPAAPAK